MLPAQRTNYQALMKYHILTYGCQMNESDSEKIATYLENKNYASVNSPELADLIIINMCSVRQSAVDRVYSKITRLRRAVAKAAMARRRQGYGGQRKIILTGCVLEKDKKKFQKMGVEFKNFDISKIKPKIAYIPIMQGCNNFCSYCVVPYTKGRERFRPQKNIICEAKHLLKQGHKKIILLGQNVNSYPNFVKLLQKITTLKGNFEISFLTNHPKDFSDELIDEIAQNKKIPKEIHLPVQSGDNKILRAMNRKYTREDYLHLVQKIKSKIPKIKLTTDIIVGFPGETEKQFQNTVKLFKQVSFFKAYIAKYSPRPGTTAYFLPDNVSPAEKQLRARQLRTFLR